MNDRFWYSPFYTLRLSLSLWSIGWNVICIQFMCYRILKAVNECVCVCACVTWKNHCCILAAENNPLLSSMWHFCCVTVSLQFFSVVRFIWNTLFSSIIFSFVSFFFRKFGFIAFRLIESKNLMKLEEEKTKKTIK